MSLCGFISQARLQDTSLCSGGGSFAETNVPPKTQVNEFILSLRCRELFRSSSISSSFSSGSSGAKCLDPRSVVTITTSGLAHPGFTTPKGIQWGKTGRAAAQTDQSGILHKVFARVTSLESRLFSPVSLFTMTQWCHSLPCVYRRAVKVAMSGAEKWDGFVI